LADNPAAEKHGKHFIDPQTRVRSAQMDTGTPTLIGRGRGMTVADLQTYLTNLADAVAATTRSDLAACDMRAAVEALEPFGQLTLEGLSAFLKVAWEYARTGKVPMPVGKRQFKKRATVDELNAALVDLRIRAASDPHLPRTAVLEALRDFKYGISHGELRAIATANGAHTSPGMMRDALLNALVDHIMTCRKSAQPVAEATPGSDPE
jgi:hypothetical protein